jgi:creatinine amidohydrolase
MTFYRWAECTRTVLNETLPNATVVLTIGATEQHGPHLATGCDHLLVEDVATAAAKQAGSSVDVVLTPTMPFGSSDHHIRFGGTLSVRTETTTQVLADLLSSIAQAGGKRVVIVNGHGGNRGPCNSASELASVRYGLHTGYVNLWQLGPVDMPGHAGAFETSMMRYLHPDLVGEIPPDEEERTYPDVPGMLVHSGRIWQSVNGYTDHPSRSSAQDGTDWFGLATAALATMLVDFDKTFRDEA